MNLVEGMVDADRLAFLIDCKRILDSSYLERLLGASYLLKAVWDGMEERSRRRLSLWKSIISPKGRLSLIESMLLDSLPFR